MSTLDGPLLTIPNAPNSANELLMWLWGIVPPSHVDSREIDRSAYFAYHRKQCKHALHDGGRHIMARTHADVIEIAEALGQGELRQTIMTQLSSKLPDPKPVNDAELLDSSIDLAARLVSMMDFGKLQYAFSGRRELVWEHGCLRDFIHSHFNEPIKLGHDVKLDAMFTGKNLGRIAGISIVWTDNLAEHLRLIDGDDKKVAIFHHVSFLRLQQRLLFPAGLVQETLQTLALFFPQNRKDTVRWLQKICPLECLDTQLMTCGHLKIDERQIEAFNFWHDRLVVLKQAFDESRPRTLHQWWCDRRNGVQWYTFWVAIMVLLLTIFFGLVQSIEGALQVYKAYNPTAPITQGLDPANTFPSKD